jgi:hypothetical protein
MLTLADNRERSVRTRQPRRAGWTRRAAGVYRVTTEAGEELRTFNPADYPKGDMGALHRAARFAASLQREGNTVLLRGAEGFRTRRYAPEYLEGTARWTYRVQCSAPACGNWVHPSNTRKAQVCREHFAQDPRLVERAGKMREAQRRKRKP